MFKRSSRTSGKLKITKSIKDRSGNTERSLLLPDKLKGETTIIRKSDPIKQKKSNRLKKLDVIIISVNYNDYLLISLSHNIKIFNNITVVTSSDDLMCQKICEKFGVNCIITDVMYENEAKFNKGKAINKGIESIIDPDFILLLDADIIVNSEINIDELVEDGFYTSDRWICRDYNSYKRFKGGEISIEEIGKCENNKGIGFFQLFNINNNVIDKSKVFPENSNDAAWSDLMFRDRFTKRQTIENNIIHLGDPYMNWNGRRTNRFITNEDFDNIIKEDKIFNINNYFDKIYCLNLNNRTDRWKKVSKQFNDFGIIVERWSAIEGDNISNEIFYEFNSNNIREKEASDKGLVENKNSLACLLSHLEIIKNAKSNGYKKILIFEDDIFLSDEFNKEIKSIEKIDWKLLYLGASQFNWLNIKPENDLYKCSKTLGTFAYALDISIYDEILKICESSKKSIDNILSDIQKSNDKCYTLFPNIVISDVSESDIRISKSMTEYSKKVKWDLNKFKKYLVETTNDLIDFEVVNISLNKGKKVLFLIYFNDVGGAEYVSYQHIKVCKELGYKPIVISAGKGMFFDKIKDLDVDLFYSKIDNLDKDSTISLLDKLSEGCEIIYNCNYFEITKYIHFLKRIKSFKYYTIAHSDIEWIIDSISEHDEITDKYIVIHYKIRK